MRLLTFWGFVKIKRHLVDLGWFFKKYVKQSHKFCEPECWKPDDENIFDRSHSYSIPIPQSFMITI